MLIILRSRRIPAHPELLLNLDCAQSKRKLDGYGKVAIPLVTGLPFLFYGGSSCSTTPSGGFAHRIALHLLNMSCSLRKSPLPQLASAYLTQPSEDTFDVFLHQSPDLYVIAFFELYTVEDFDWLNAEPEDIGEVVKTCVVAESLFADLFLAYSKQETEEGVWIGTNSVDPLAQALHLPKSGQPRWYVG